MCKQGNVASEFDYEDAVVRYPTMYEESMNTVLQQEIIRYNKLLKVIHTSLKSIKKALKGEVVMSEELEKMGTSLFNNQVPDMWAEKAYPSLKPLAAWVNDLKVSCARMQERVHACRLNCAWRSARKLCSHLCASSHALAPPTFLCFPQERTSFVQRWFEHGKPLTFWISGFYFPQAFLTGTLQNFARRRQLPIDTISWAYQMVDVPVDQLAAEPEIGVYIYGLFIEVRTRTHPACAGHTLSACACCLHMRTSLISFLLYWPPRRVACCAGCNLGPDHQAVG